MVIGHLPGRAMPSIQSHIKNSNLLPTIFVLMLNMSQLAIFQSFWDIFQSSWVEPVLSRVFYWSKYKVYLSFDIKFLICVELIVQQSKQYLFCYDL